ncbi:VOC family protein [Bradyrhizobium sp. Leo121]|uniref:VOC family protein n=1 Tax=Bradyrhizobium sp. Leo121 TaxID=1571195 RepID=UPI001028C19C|nr:VOC family protein [Bradyrhizobium sp. Leo121]RZN35759.1 lactoylglutathione lyase [Bradyrhizobium sp. Leo121]
MTKMIFLNLPVKDLAAATRFYEAIGCKKNEQFSTDQAAMMAWSDTITFHLLTHDYFASFSAKPIAAANVSEVLIALSRASRQEVDAICEAAAITGGKADVRPPQDMGFMYLRSFEDPDGHVFEPMWMDPTAIANQSD